MPVLEASGLLGRGGAGFPVAANGDRRQSAVRPATVLVNAAEGEPLSAKDRTLLGLRPHLVLDGASRRGRRRRRGVVLYVGRATGTQARRGAGLRGASRRSPSISWPLPKRMSPARNRGGPLRQRRDARPTTTPPRVFERGIGGRPTLVQNVETLAYVALIARRGDGWYREPVRGTTRGSALVTVSGSGGDGIREIEIGTTIGELAAETAPPATWATPPPTARPSSSAATSAAGSRPSAAWDLPLDPVALRAAGHSFGCGVVDFLARSLWRPGDGLDLDWMAGQSAAQCGPCVFGLRAIADATNRVANGAPDGDELERLRGWAGQVAGRGACRHPDGAVGQLLSSLRVFEAEWELHQRRRTCSRERAGISP